MATLRACATEFVPCFASKTNGDQCIQSVRAQHFPAQPQQAQETGAAEQQQSLEEQEYGCEAGCYGENGDRVSYEDFEDDVYAANEQEWQGGQDWSSCTELQQQQQHGEQQHWQTHRQHQQQIPHEQHGCENNPSQQQSLKQQQRRKAETPAAAAAAAVEEPGDSSWNDLAISSGQAVQLLHSWYPDHSVTMLKQLLETCEGQLQDALQILSDLEHEAQQTMQQQQQQQQSSEAAACQNPTVQVSGGAAAAARSVTAAPARQQQQKRGFNLQEEMFPDLSTAAAVGKQQQATAPYAQPGIGQGSSCKGHKWSAVAARAAATQSHHNEFGAGTATAQLRSKPQHAPSSSNSNRGGVSAAAAAAAAAAVPWVETGETVSREYAAARAQASDHARVRNACFHQATIAYLAGDKALAKELSAKGKHAAQQMWEAHERASKKIFTQRNDKLAAAAAGSRPGGSSSSSSTSGVLDLHGLHVREVTALLPQQLAQFAKQQQQHVSLIVGTGHHTKGPPSARVGPAVETLLQELGYAYRQLQPGLLRVQLQ